MIRLLTVEVIAWTGGRSAVTVRWAGLPKTEGVPIGRTVATVEKAQVIASWLQDSASDLQKYLQGNA